MSVAFPLKLKFDGRPDGDAVTLNEVTLKELTNFRSLFNGTAVDGIMYMTPRHLAATLAFVRQEMNKTYHKFSTCPSPRTSVMDRCGGESHGHTMTTLWQY